MLGTLDKMDSTQKGLIQKFEAERPLTYFAIVFICVFLCLAFLGSALIGPAKSIYKSIGSSAVSSIINKKPERQRIAEVVDDPQSVNSIRVNVQYHDKASPEGIVPVKYTSIDVFREAVIPFVFVLSLILATPIPYRRRMIALLYGFLIAQAYIFLKFFVLTFDNYRSPDFAAYQFPGLIDFFVYMFAKFFAVTGYSSSVIVPLLIWIMASFRAPEISALKEWFSKAADRQLKGSN